MEMKMNIFLTLAETSEQAMEFYTTVFPQTKIEKIDRYPKGMPYTPDSMVGKVLHGVLNLQGNEIYFMDMDKQQAPATSWASSLYLDLTSEAEFDDIFKKLADKGNVMMGPEAVGDLRKVAWVVDRFGITWQLIWA
jgi:predicted 3-demethylubiquinone-9 3-methyltransferase (glyoxalase superfamily)